MNAPATNPALLSPFHLAFPVHDLAAARAFYGGLLGCPEGRSSPEWVDFNFHGHQIVAHLAPHEAGEARRNAVDGHGVPVRHFGVVLPMAQWRALARVLWPDCAVHAWPEARGSQAGLQRFLSQ
jgi:extradiol dioxygenase family protein